MLVYIYTYIYKMLFQEYVYMTLRIYIGAVWEMSAKMYES